MKRNVKKIKFLTAMFLILGLVFASCSKKEMSNENDSDSNPESAYFSVSISTESGGTTRSSGFLGEDQGTLKERAVKRVVIVLYGTEPDGDLKKQIILDAKSDGNTKFTGTDVIDQTASLGTIIPTATQFVSKPKSVIKQDYDMLVMVNPGGNLILATSENMNKKKSDFTAAVTEDDASNYYESDGSNIFMSNNRGFRRIPASSLRANETDAQTSAFGIEVDRIVAKIYVRKDDNFSVVFDGADAVPAITDISWGLDNVNRQTYLMRRPAGILGSTTTAIPEEINWITNTFTSAEKLYAIDPNMSVSSMTAGNLSDNFAKITDAGYTKSFLNEPLNALTQYIYTLENTMNADEQTADNISNGATRVALKCKIKPVVGGVTWNNYYSYNGKIFTHDQAVEWTSMGTFPQGFGTAAEFAAAVTAANDELGNNTFNFGTGIEPTAFKSASNSLTYHLDGLNIYYIPIKHFQSDQLTGINNTYLGFYGVVRNNIYIVNVNKINGPGSVSSTNYYMSANVNISQWKKRVQDEEL